MVQIKLTFFYFLCYTVKVIDEVVRKSDKKYGSR